MIIQLIVIYLIHIKIIIMSYENEAKRIIKDNTNLTASELLMILIDLSAEAGINVSDLREVMWTMWDELNYPE